jgi:hypothetical protein
VAISFDGATKLITLSSGVVELGVRDLWSRWVDWVATSDNSKFLPAMRTVGGDDIDTVAGTRIPIYTYLLNGWQIKPDEADHTLDVVDGILLVDGGGDPFADTVGAYTVRVNYQQPVQAITVATGSSGAPSAATIAAAVVAALQATVTPVNVKQMNDAAVIGDGSESDPWRGVGVPP